jgi:hypothetical protein
MFISFRQQQKSEISRDFRPETGTRRTGYRENRMSVG